MKKKHAAIVFATLALLTFVLAHSNLAANASGHRWGAHAYGSHGFGPYAWPFFGGLSVVPPGDFGLAPGSAPATTVVTVAEPPRALSCHHSREIVEVPSEDGGTKPITITRC
jgi:hypothetical protein